MNTGNSRRAVAEMRFGEDRAGVAKVGGRSIHQYWSLLSPHFRDVFLAPQRRSDDGGVSWTWREPVDNEPATASELAGLRNRLARARESFAENPVSPLSGETRNGAGAQEMMDQLALRVKTLADKMTALPDAVLAEFVCRTETGLMIHSWGLDAAAKIIHPDALESGVEGVVVSGGKGSSGNEVVIENAQGLRVARTVTDESGAFAFPKLGPGRYRVRVISGPGEYPEKGAAAVVARGAMTRVEIRSISDPEVTDAAAAGGDAPPASAPVDAPSIRRVHRRRWWWAGLALLLLGAGLVVWLALPTQEAGDRLGNRISTLTPEDYSTQLPSVSRGDGNESRAGRGGASSPSHSPPGGLAARQSPGKIETRVELLETTGNQTLPTPPQGIGALDASRDARLQRTDVASGANAADASGSAPLKASSGATATPSDAEEAEISLMRPATALPGEPRDTQGGSSPGSPAGQEHGRTPGLGAGTGTADTPDTPTLPTMAGKPPNAARDGESIMDEPQATDNGTAGQGRQDAVRTVTDMQGPEADVDVVERESMQDRHGEAPEQREQNTSTQKAAPSSRPESQDQDHRSATQRALLEKKKQAVKKDAATPAETTTTDQTDAGAKNPGRHPSGQKTGSVKPSADSQSDAPGPVGQQAGPDRTAVRIRPAAPLPEGMRIVAVIKLSAWSLRPGRDAIVPTLPVPAGEPDTSLDLAERMLAELQARVPEMLRRPNLQSGFVFRHVRDSETQPLVWRETPEGHGIHCTIQEKRAETGWMLPRRTEGRTLHLDYANGTEAARIEFAPGGQATVAVRDGVRAAFWLGALYTQAERSESGRPPYYFWRVVRGPLAASAWTSESRWLDGAGCRLEVVLNGARPDGTCIALIDQETGWQLTTWLEPAP